jgi:hypothetical protein
MKAQMKSATIAMALYCGLLCPALTQAAEQSAPSAAQRAHNDAQRLLREWDAARPKAQAAERLMRESGLNPASLGFDSARELRDRQALSGSKLEAYDRYFKTAKKLEKSIREEVYIGTKAVLCQDIARFERLQAEVDLARIEGRLPAAEKK